MGLRHRRPGRCGERERAGFWRDRPTFVTGATGLVGGWLVRRLVDAGADVVCLVRDWVPQSELVAQRRCSTRVKVVRGDVRDGRTLERVLGEYEIDTVFHLAAQTIVPHRQPQPGLDLRDQHRRHVGAAGGLPPQPEASGRSWSPPPTRPTATRSSCPTTRTTPLQGRHPYDVSKSCADLIAQAYAVTYGLPVAITRCGNFYGGGDLNWNRIVPGTIRSVLRGQRPVIRSDGSSVRDYFYVEDGAAAYMLLAESAGGRPQPGRRGVQLLQRDAGHRARAGARPSCALMGSRARAGRAQRGQQRDPHQYLSAAKARERLGWRPLFTLDEGLGRTIDWYRAFLASS